MFRYNIDHLKLYFVVLYQNQNSHCINLVFRKIGSNQKLRNKHQFILKDFLKYSKNIINIERQYF